ncbi:MAG: hypothetical protein M1833_001904 [Piccolia ochrophora]|nr:MAG: hypothetical protein M1833_001904 [Piccolia ochrophora]
MKLRDKSKIKRPKRFDSSPQGSESEQASPTSTQTHSSRKVKNTPTSSQSHSPPKVKTTSTPPRPRKSRARPKSVSKTTPAPVQRIDSPEPNTQPRQEAQIQREPQAQREPQSDGEPHIEGEPQTWQTEGKPQGEREPELSVVNEEKVENERNNDNRMAGERRGRRADNDLQPELKEYDAYTDIDWFNEQCKTSDDEGADTEHGIRGGGGDNSTATADYSDEEENFAPTWDDVVPCCRTLILDKLSNNTVKNLPTVYQALQLSTAHIREDMERRLERYKREEKEEENIRNYQEAVTARDDQVARSGYVCPQTAGSLSIPDPAAHRDYQALAEQYLFAGLPREPDYELPTEDELVVAALFASGIGLDSTFLEEEQTLATGPMSPGDATSGLLTEGMPTLSKYELNELAVASDAAWLARTGGITRPHVAINNVTDLYKLRDPVHQRPANHVRDNHEGSARTNEANAPVSQHREPVGIGDSQRAAHATKRNTVFNKGKAVDNGKMAPPNGAAIPSIEAQDNIEESIHVTPRRRRHPRPNLVNPNIVKTKPADEAPGRTDSNPTVITTPRPSKPVKRILFTSKNLPTAQSDLPTLNRPLAQPSQAVRQEDKQPAHARVFPSGYVSVQEAVAAANHGRPDEQSSPISSQGRDRRLLDCYEQRGKEGRDAGR